MRYTSVIQVVLALAVAVGAQSSAAPALTLEHFERLSFDVRGHRLRAAEREAVQSSVSGGSHEAEQLYAALVQDWLDKDALKRYVDTFLQFAPVTTVDPTADTFFHRLSRHGEGEAAVYYLPHTVEADASGPPCPAEETALAGAWWQDEPIAVCNESHRPEVVFDAIGYCSGEAEPLMRQPPRPGCGCGPLLMGCLPPEGDAPRLDVLVRDSVADEWYETAARIVDEDRSLDELLTTSRTWQTGLAEFLYLRREFLGELHATPWSPGKQIEIERRVADVDIYAEGRWVERTGLYEGTGIWWTSLAPHALKIPVRGVSHHLLARHLGSDFHAVNVDAKAVLEAVGRDEQNLRTLSSITAAPMRFTKGCQGCHAPMDGVAGFLGELQGPMYGSFPTGLPAEGEFFVSGAEDFRGKGAGVAELSRFVVRQPEFETVSVRRAFEGVMLRPLGSRDQALFEELGAEFRRNGHRWRPILQRLFESDAYRHPGDPVPAGSEVASTTAMSDVIPEVVSRSCTSCHDQYHDVLDLRELPSRKDVATWTRIWSRVTDYSMPPPAFDGKITGRFPPGPLRPNEVRRRPPPDARPCSRSGRSPPSTRHQSMALDRPRRRRARAATRDHRRLDPVAERSRRPAKAASPRLPASPPAHVGEDQRGDLP